MRLLSPPRPSPIRHRLTAILVTSFLALGLLSAAGSSRGWAAAASCLPAATPLVIDPGESALDTQPPSPPAVGAVEVVRGQQAGCAQSADSARCEALGQVRVMVSATDDWTLPSALGFRATVARGVAPSGLAPLDVAVLADPDGFLVLSWTDGATAGQEPLDFDLRIATVDRAGDVSAGAATLTVRDPGQGSTACRIGPARGGRAGATRALLTDLLPALALAGGSLWRRGRRRCPRRGRGGRPPVAAPPDAAPPGQMAEFFAPWALAAVALMAFNDHVLKRHFPGALSGKLSDVAVCFFLPLYLSALLGLLAPRRRLLRLTMASLVTAILFASLELSATAVDGFCRLNDAVAGPLGIARRCRLTRDPTDLATLVFVPLAWLYGRARLRAQRRDQDIPVRFASPAGRADA